MRIEQWTDDDLPLLRRLVGDAAMMAHLGGAETEEQVLARQVRYVVPGSGAYRIVDPATGEAVGFVGLWEREWLGEQVYETGWSVLPEHQGRGIATAATSLVLDLARREAKHAAVHAFPGVDNAASNAVCRRLGFVLRGAVEVEYPPGHQMRCNDWRLALS